ncbi:protein kinase domain-containing protein [Streptomonospora litoralis]|uniref:Serine/threonine-protein kinase PknA n=1 Tax=Streptomonospora litoralis TaxID=2498135 RepID=A0A4P6Q541_9ACTN|nr:protein kinase [Streptomonospora litoralis]QBI53867.1 Serine/threonine-protein kinase PknA [Streptomonospora litoralis]
MPESWDPDSPTRNVEPAGTTTRLDADRARTRWVTRVLRPRTGASPGAGDSGRTRAHTRPHTRALTRAGLTPRTAEGAAERPAPPWWRRLLAPLFAWFPRLLTRVVVGPAGEIDYAVPADLRRSYTVLERIGSGGEAVVYLAEPLEAGRRHERSASGERAGRRIALKVYRPGHDINRELLDRLRARGEGDPHTPAIDGYGWARSSWDEEVAWEAQEYFADGSLRSVMERSPVDDATARAVVAAVADCLRHWQEDLQHNHTDVKPENLLVRSSDPPVFALTDFGGAVRATMSRVYGGLAITEAYAAPEVVEGRREAPAAWWSLGVMVHELLTGRRPERGESWLTARSTEIDVSAITDESWRLLARGLLTPAPSARWGHAEVREWLAGGRPTIARPRRHAPISFADTSHDDPPSLAFDLLDRWDRGEVWLRTHWPTLRTWLDREVNDYTFDRAYLTDLDARPERVHLAISALAARFVPGMPPRFRGLEVGAEGVLALARGGASRHAALREALELGALDLAARHWCGHPGCRAEGVGRCAPLEHVQHDVPLIMRQVEATVRGLAEGPAAAAGAADLPRHAWDGAWALAVELVLDPDAAGRERGRLRAQSWHPRHRSPAPHVDWWRRQRDTGLSRRSGALAANSALVAASLLQPVAARIGAAQREHDKQEGRARRRDRRAAFSDAVADRWQRVRGRIGGSGTAQPADPSGAPWGTTPYGGYGTHYGRPLTEVEQRKARRREEKERARVNRSMRQIERAQGAGRGRRFAYPAAVLGLLDGLGRLLRAGGFYPDRPGPFADAYTAVVEFTASPIVSAVAAAAGAVVGLLPGDVEDQWWLPALLGVLLVLLGRKAASRSPARSRLVSYRIAVAGSLLMLLVLCSTGLLMVGAGVLIPLYNVFG